MAAQYESLEYHFTPEELRELGAELARANQQIYDLRAEHKNQTATMGAAIKAAEKQAAALTLKVNQRFEYRDVEVIPMMDTPRPGLKTILRVDNNQEIRTEAMSLEEQQRELNFGSDDKDKDKGPGKK